MIVMPSACGDRDGVVIVLSVRGTQEARTLAGDLFDQVVR